MATARVTLSDVATRAGVSRTTASYVTNGRHDMRISPSTEQRVLTAVRDLDYRPSLLARGLRTQSMQTVGFISEAVASDPYAGALIRGAMVAALRHQQLLFVAETGGDPALEERLVQSMLDRGVGGFIYASMYTRTVRLSTTLRRHPLVLLNCVSKHRSVAAVVPDEQGAGRSAAHALLAAGHRDRIFLVGEHPADVIAARERVAGITEALAEQWAALAGAVESLWWPDPAYHAVLAFLRSAARPSALICLNDRVALGAYQAISAAGLRVPDDISIVSFDDSDLASWLRPALTSIAIPHAELGRRAAERLLDPSPDPPLEQVPMPLRERGSVAAPRELS